MTFGLFDDSRVHSIDLKVEDWEGFISEAPEEEYVQCDVAIDGEMYGNVGLRAKGNNSLGLADRGVRPGAATA